MTTLIVSIVSLLLYWSSALALINVESKQIKELQESTRSVHELEP